MMSSGWVINNINVPLQCNALPRGSRGLGAKCQRPKGAFKLTSFNITVSIGFSWLLVALDGFGGVINDMECHNQRTNSTLKNK